MQRWVLTGYHQIGGTLSINHSTSEPHRIPAITQEGLWALFVRFYMLVHVASILWFKWLLGIKAKCLKAHVIFVLLSDFDECNLVYNNCTKGGANCTNTLGSFNCTCQTRYFWNGMKCEGLFTLILFRLMWTSFQGVFLTIFCLFLSLPPSHHLPVFPSLSLFPALSLS